MRFIVTIDNDALMGDDGQGNDLLPDSEEIAQEIDEELSKLYGRESVLVVPE